MYSLEKRHRSADLDQGDPEHLDRVATETTWDDLKKVPFKGSQEDLNDTLRRLNDAIDGLSNKTDDETASDPYYEKRKQQLLDEMKDISKFGGNNSNDGLDENKSAVEEFNNLANGSDHKESESEDEFKKQLSDIDSSF
jgi:hypothetical protein